MRATERTHPPVRLSWMAVFLPTGCAVQQSALAPAAPQAGLIADFWWAMLVVATGVTVTVIVLLLVGVSRARRGARESPLSQRQSRRLVWAGGILLPLAVAAPFLVASFSVGRVVDAPPPKEALTVEVVGRLWWWEVHYLDDEGRRIATTANEIHVPVGQTTRFRLISDNVIHSFWVPNLHGKVDLIPGRTNTLSFTVSEPGVYRGQCAEYCGIQHALMGFLVIAEPPEAFSAWLARQRLPAREPDSPLARHGRQVFMNSSCSDCHTIRGTPARADEGPDLTHFATRRTLAAATLPNRIGHLGGWIADPQSVKPGNKMPPTVLAPADFHALLRYLKTLK